MSSSTEPCDPPSPASNAPAPAPQRPTPGPLPGKAPEPPKASERLAWIPIRSLGPGHRPRILEHLQALSEHDRYLRFGFAAGDAQIQRYVDGLDFERDEVFGVFNRRLRLIALAHLACPADETPPKAAEFGGSVAAHVRGRGYGARLFEHAMLHARNRGIDTLFIHALSENIPMLRIARRAGATVERAGSESDAYLKLPPETFASQVEQFVGEGAAALDYQLKQQARIVDAFMDALTEVRAGVGRSGAAKD